MNRLFLLFVIKIWKILLYIPLIGDRESQRIAGVFPHILSLDETVDRLIHGYSIARFGDGEIRLILGHRLPFQRFDTLLRHRLLEILQAVSYDRFLVGHCPFSESPVDRSFKASWNRFAAFIRKDILHQKNISRQNNRYSYYQWNWMQCWRFLESRIPAAEYGDAQISRMRLFQHIPLEKIRKIWQNRDVVFVVPKNGKFVFDARLFGSVRSAEYLYIKPVNAFDDYSRILTEALQKEKSKLFFIAAGPTATVLAYDLHQAGYQALDFGHLPMCYREFLGEAPAPEKLDAFGQILQ
ncbi:MAG: GT-D fold domain-containing protein [Planctomycetaceae bacterium]|jgi:hypothetical protein|nr:GT-D fold domain-containing protein [Planctomycetaceae bacterium]